MISQPRKRPYSLCTLQICTKMLRQYRTHYDARYFFWAAGPFSRSNAAYDTCRLARAVMPTYNIESRIKLTKRAMKRPDHISAFPKVGILEGQLTRCEILVLLEQREGSLIACCPPMHIYITLQIHMHKWRHRLIHFVWARLGGIVASWTRDRGGGVNNRILRRRNHIKKIRKKNIYSRS